MEKRNIIRTKDIKAETNEDSELGKSQQTKFFKGIFNFTNKVLDSNYETQSNSTINNLKEMDDDMSSALIAKSTKKIVNWCEECKKCC